MNGIVAARAWGIGVGLLCVGVAACAPIPDSVATSGCGTASAMLAKSVVGPAVDTKEAILKRLSDSSRASGADIGAEIAARQVGFLFSARMMVSKGMTLPQGMAGAQDSLTRVPAILQKVKYLEGMMALGHARNLARRNSALVHPLDSLADTVEYYAVIDNIASITTDTTLSSSEGAPLLAAITASEASAYPQDTAFITWTTVAVSSSTELASATESALVYEWEYEGATGPVYSFSSSGVCIIGQGGPANVQAWPGWLKIAVSAVGAAVSGAYVAFSKNGVSAASGGALDGLEGWGYLYAIETMVDGIRDSGDEQMCADLAADMGWTSYTCTVH